MAAEKKLRIAFVITGLLAGGAERVMANLANELVANGHNIRIIVMKKAVTDYKLDSRIEFVGADALSVNGKNHFFKGLRFYVKNIREYKPDLVVSFLPKTIIISMLCKFLLFKKIPVIACERANPRARKGIVGIFNNILFKKADGCAFQTREARDYYNIKDISKVAILNNPMSEDFCVDVFLGERKKEIVTAGRVSKQKNHSLLIDAFAMISDKYPEYKLIIYGDGPLMNNLRNKVTQLGLSEKVILPGRVDNIKDKIYESSLFVLSSDFEGMPNALLEAMALGLPCISTDCPVGGPGEVIRSYENGILVPVGNAEAMAEAMDKALLDKKFAEKLGKNANKIYEKFSSKKVAEEWESFIYKIYKQY